MILVFFLGRIVLFLLLFLVLLCFCFVFVCFLFFVFLGGGVGVRECTVAIFISQLTLCSKIVSKVCHILLSWAFCFLDPKKYFKLIWLSNLLTLSVPNVGFQK